MADPTERVSVPITGEDKEAIEDILESSPFKQDLLLQIAMRIGLKAIQKDPTILMPYLAKRQQP